MKKSTQNCWKDYPSDCLRNDIVNILLKIDSVDFLKLFSIKILILKFFLKFVIKNSFIFIAKQFDVVLKRGIFLIFAFRDSLKNVSAYCSEMAFDIIDGIIPIDSKLFEYWVIILSLQLSSKNDSNKNHTCNQTSF